VTRRRSVLCAFDAHDGTLRALVVIASASRTGRSNVQHSRHGGVAEPISTIL
jgi:hypothetical protein